MPVVPLGGLQVQVVASAPSCCLRSGQTTSCLAPSTQVSVSWHCLSFPSAEVCKGMLGRGQGESRRWAMWKLRKEGRSCCDHRPAGPGGGVLDRVTVGLLPARVPAVGPWLSVVPAHVERIRARKDTFSCLPSWKEDQGDLVTAQRFWACGQAHFPSCPSPRQPGRCTPSAGSPKPRAPSQLGEEAVGRPAFPFPEPPAERKHWAGGLMEIRQQVVCTIVIGPSGPEQSWSRAAKM